MRHTFTAAALLLLASFAMAQHEDAITFEAELTFRNNRDHEVSFTIPKGALFDLLNLGQNRQNLVTYEPFPVTLKAGETKTITIGMLCTNHGASATSGERIVPTPLRMDPSDVDEEPSGRFDDYIERLRSGE